VAANGRRGRPQGKCHREETAGAGQLVQARVKRCGKSAPRLRRRRRHGKPHREQDRIGAARVLGATLASSAILAAARVGCSRHGAIRAPEEWPSRRDPLQTEPGLQAGWQISSPALFNGREFWHGWVMTTITLEKAQQDLPLLVERALAGEEIVIEAAGAAAVSSLPSRRLRTSPCRRAQTTAGAARSRGSFSSAPSSSSR
jgi:antitoxin (DNA-binding transcriptional repressor) of toxin-antitoxin stability system